VTAQPEKPTRPPRLADFDEDVDPEIRGRERRQLLSLSLRLSKERPVPRPGMRSAFRARLLGGGRRAAAESERAMSIGRVRTLVAGYAMAGTLLLVVAGAGVAGAGPFAA
jgi:hypothetical protein